MTLKGLNHNERIELLKERKKKNERKKKISFLCLSFIVCLGLISLVCFEGFIKTHYNKDALVIYVDENKNMVSCVTIDGNEWDFQGNDFQVEDEIKVTFFNNLTDNNIYDDEIIKAKKK